MKSLADQEWEQLNAWADGELTGSEAEDFSRRLEREPALNEALTSVKQVKSALAALRPEMDLADGRNAANGNRRPWLRRLAGVAVAAMIAAAVILATSGAPPSALDIHLQYAAQEYSLDDRSGLLPVAGPAAGGFPRLDAAGLFLVASRGKGNRASAHYAGLKGCRLTVLRGPFAPAPLSEGVQTRRWAADNTRYQVVATGMDPAKFAATATYLEQFTQNRLQKAAVMALHQAGQSSTNCRFSSS